MTAIAEKSNDRIDGEKIIISATGTFPKRVIVVDQDCNALLEYRLVKSKSGKLLLNK